MVRGGGLTWESRKFISIFPALAGTSWRVTSPATNEYNCIAWALGDTTAWWWPTGALRLGGYYWPRGVPADGSVASFVALFEGVGYAICDSLDEAAGFDRLAVYADERQRVTHVARQLNSGLWTSKIGRMQDITHDSPSALAGAAYGDVVAHLRRPATHTDVPAPPT